MDKDAIKETGRIKCVVWDLDNTLWEGVLLESNAVHLKAGVADVLRQLDERGILHSVASRNDYERAMDQMRAFGIDEYFLYPQIGWQSKSASLKEIARRINIGTDTLAFVDDQVFEREEVLFSLPEVLCIDAADFRDLPEWPQMQPRFLTDDSRVRRRRYQEDQKRRALEEEFSGRSEEFLRTLDMRFAISRAVEEDLRRAEELTVRTHQLNTTGYSYSYEELKAFSQSASHLLLIAELEDRFGGYGKIGLALVETGREVWCIKLLLMSCRVMSRGVGTVLLNYIMREAARNGVKLRAELVPNGKNRMMHVTYKFAGFREIDQRDEARLLESDLKHIQEFPDYIQVRAPTG